MSTVSPEPAAPPRWLEQVVRWRMGIVLLVLVGTATALQPRIFPNPANLSNVARQMSFEGLIAFGMTLIIVTGGIDLSVGSLVALSGIVSGLVLRGMHGQAVGIGIAVALSAGIAIGLAVGALNGWIITRLNLPPFIVTLAAMLIARGVALIASDGQPIIDGMTPTFETLGRGVILGIPVPVLFLLAGFALFHVLLSRTVFGRSVIAIGSNAEAARLSGIAVRRTRLLVYVLTGALCGLVGVLHHARLGSADPKIGEMWELNIIAAVVVGGTSLFGGRGSIPGTLVGALIIGVLNNILNLCHVDPNYQKVVLGSVILLAALLDAGLNRLRR